MLDGWTIKLCVDPTNFLGLCVLDNVLWFEVLMSSVLSLCLLLDFVTMGFRFNSYEMEKFLFHQFQYIYIVF